MVRSELFALKWDNINFSNETLNVVEPSTIRSGKLQDRRLTAEFGPCCYTINTFFLPLRPEYSPP
jgi:hypothetical protein